MVQSQSICYAGGEPATTTCTTCHKPICGEHTRMGEPFISLGDIVRTATRSPSLLLGPPLNEVAYCPDCRQQLAGRRTIEQMKFMGLLLLVLVLAGVAIFVLTT